MKRNAIVRIIIFSLIIVMLLGILIVKSKCDYLGLGSLITNIAA